MCSHGSSLMGFPNNILQGWFKMKTTSIFPVHGLASLILMSKYAGHGSSLRGFPDNILQGWFKMKTTSIFPVHGLASLIIIEQICTVMAGGFLTIFYKAGLR